LSVLQLFDLATALDEYADVKLYQLSTAQGDRWTICLAKHCRRSW